MKITFVLPDLNYVREYMPDYDGVFAQGIGYLSSSLKHAGHEVSLIHVTKDPERDNYIEILKGEKPGLVAFSLFSHQFGLVKELAGFTKEAGGFPTIAGGVHPTIAPENTLSDDSIDMVCIGEGEEALVELCDKMDRGEDYKDVGSVWVKDNGIIVRNSVRTLNQNLENRPFPDRSIFDFEKLADAKLGMLTVLAGRGCPYNCTYCCNHQYKKLYADSGKYVRFRDPESVIREIKEVKKDYPYLEFVNFLDDTFCLNKNWLRKFLPRYKEEINMPFHGNSHVNVLSEDVVKLLKETGCEHLSIGIESGNEHIRKEVLDRHMSNEQIINAFTLGRKYGINFSSYNMVGVPFEKIENTMETVKLNATVKSYKTHVSIFQPYPHTRLYDICKENNFLNNGDSEVSTFFGNSVVALPSISNEQIQFSYKYFNVFLKLYGVAYFMLPGAFSGIMEKVLDKLYLMPLHRFYLKIYPVVFPLVFPTAFIKRMLLRIAPRLVRRLKKIITKRSYS
jgi:radical SAM superfamily enzyme YgiQ (UPF0313 family)